jgi:preprotein translocase subunit SecB
MDIERKPSDFKALTRVVRKADLSELFLLNSNVNRSLDALEYESLRANFTFNGGLLEKKDEWFSAKVTLSLIGTPAEDRDKTVIEINAGYVLIYTLDNYDGISDDDLEVFCSMNSLYNVWSFWREYIQNICNRMGIPPVTLPLLKFKPRKPKEKDQEQPKEPTDKK